MIVVLSRLKVYTTKVVNNTTKSNLLFLNPQECQFQ